MVAVPRGKVNPKWYNAPMTLDFPPYRFSFCPRPEAERVLANSEELRARLSLAEVLALEALPERRKLDRVAGRLAVKRALAEYYLHGYGRRMEAGELEVFNDDRGRPRLVLPKEATALAPSFSISHCAQGGVAAVASPGRRVGVDIEIIVPRPAAVIAFVASENEPVCGPSDPERQARMWVGKEATLKMLGLGLDSDARAVHCEADGAILTGVPAMLWATLGSPRVRIDYGGVAGACIAVAYTGD